MSNIIMFCAGILLIAFVKLSYRATKGHLGQRPHDHSVIALLWVNVAFALLMALGVFLMIDALRSAGVLRDLRSHFLPSAPAGATAGKGDPGGDIGQTMGLVFAALGVIMTLVTAIVISVARASVEDIRRIEDRFMTKRDQINHGIEDVRKAREISEARLALVMKSIRASRSNLNAIRTIKSNTPKGTFNPGTEHDLRVTIEEFYSANDGNLEQIKIFAAFISEHTINPGTRNDFFTAMGSEGLGYVIALKAAVETCYQDKSFDDQRTQITGVLKELTDYCYWHEYQNKLDQRRPA
jgi:hypothetical protein